MTRWVMPQTARQGVMFLLMAGLASCVSAPPPQPPAPPRPAPPPPVVRAAPSPQQDWRDIALTPGSWSWHGGAGQPSIAQFGVLGQAAVFAVRCDMATRSILFSRAGSLSAASGMMQITTSFGPIALAAGNGGGQPPAIVAQVTARDPRLDQIAFSRGRFLVDGAGQARLVLPAWPEVARVIEDCR